MQIQEPKPKKSIPHRLFDCATILVVSLCVVRLEAQPFYPTEGVPKPFPSAEIGSWGFINAAGKFVISPRFNSGGEFHNGFAEVAAFNNNPKDCVDRRVITIDASGKEIPTPERKFLQTGILLPPEFSECGEFTDDVAFAVFNGASFRTVTDSSEAAKLLKAPGFHNFDEQNRLCVPVPRKCALIDKTGKVKLILPGEPDWDRRNFSEGLLPLRMGELKGLVDTRGNVIGKPQFEMIWPFSEGLAAVRMRPKSWWGFIDRTGNVVIPCTFSIGAQFHEGLARVESAQSHEAGFINKTGKFVFHIAADRCSDFSEGLTTYSAPRFQQSGALDHSGKYVFKRKLNDRLGTFHNGLCSASTVVDGHELWGYLDKRGHWVIEPKYLKADNFSEGLASVCVNDPAKVKLQEKEDRERVREIRMQKDKPWWTF